MNETTKKFEDLSKEKQKELKVAGRKLVMKMFFNGLNYGGLIFVSNLILIFANEAFFKSALLLLTSALAADVILLHMAKTANKEAVENFRTQAKEIVESK